MTGGRVFPLFVDLTDRLVVVIGGGPVGRRKAESLLDAGAIVRLVCLEERPSELGRPRLVWLRESFGPDHLAGATLAFACASSSVNRRVVAESRRRGIWVNCADDPAAGDFVLPAMFRRGDLVVAVGTSGAAPALARHIRNQLERQVDSTYAEWVAILKELRPLALASIDDAATRRSLLEQWCELRWLDRLKRDGVGSVRAEMMEQLRRIAGGLIE